ncbi:hypothetical protein BC628DRAFT_1379009 [Trametes gibbosa]|nr:hypothetical protein BC628DRAFT_1379009 [Trametes gibbosa]
MIRGHRLPNLLALLRLNVRPSQLCMAGVRIGRSSTLILEKSLTYSQSYSLSSPLQPASGKHNQGINRMSLSLDRSSRSPRMHNGTAYHAVRRRSRCLSMTLTCMMRLSRKSERPASRPPRCRRAADLQRADRKTSWRQRMICEDRSSHSRRGGV